MSAYDGRTIDEIIHDFAVIRGDLAEQYARDQLVAIIEARLDQERRSRDEAWDAYREAIGVPEGEHTSRRMERIAQQYERLFEGVRSLDTGYAGGGNKHAYCIDPRRLRALLAPRPDGGS